MTVAACCSVGAANPNQHGTQLSPPKTMQQETQAEAAKSTPIPSPALHPPPKQKDNHEFSQYKCVRTPPGCNPNPQNPQAPSPKTRSPLPQSHSIAGAASSPRAASQRLAFSQAEMAQLKPSTRSNKASVHSEPPEKPGGGGGGAGSPEIVGVARIGGGVRTLPPCQAQKWNLRIKPQGQFARKPRNKHVSTLTERFCIVLPSPAATATRVRLKPSDWWGCLKFHFSNRTQGCCFAALEPSFCCNLQLGIHPHLKMLKSLFWPNCPPCSDSLAAHSTTWASNAQGRIPGTSVRPKF